MKIIRFPALFANLISEARFNEAQQVVEVRTTRKGVVGEWLCVPADSIGLKEHGGHKGLWNHFCNQVGNPLYATNGKYVEFATP